MSSTTSSPFVENPRSMLNEDSEFSMKQNVSNLEFQISCLKTEKKLLNQEKESMSSKYEDIIRKRNEELSSLQSNFDFLYEQKRQMESKNTNSDEISSKRIKAMTSELADIQKENFQLSESNRVLENRYSSLSKKYNQIRTDLNYQLKANDEMEVQIKRLQSETEKCYQSKDELIERLQEMSSHKSETVDMSIVDSLRQKNISLQKMNNQLHQKVDQLLQNKMSFELLKQKNISLSNRVAYLENFEEKYCSLEVENMELKSKFDDMFKCIYDSIKVDKSESEKTVVLKFFENFKALQNENLLLLDKYERSQSDLSKAHAELDHLNKSIIEEFEPRLDYLTESLNSKGVLVEKLERQKVLNQKEIDYLRNSLKQMDEIMNQKNAESTNNRSTNEYLTNLEKLVDEYRTEIGNLQRQVTHSKSNVTADSSIGEKRPRIVNDESVSKISRDFLKLNDENAELRLKLRDLSSDIVDMRNKSSKLEAINSKKKELQVLQLKSNPVAKDQVIKKATLDLLRKENNELIQKFIKNNDSIDLVPKSIFERQEQDKALLQHEIEEISKRINRLKKAYAQKSKDILSIISRYFGYNIEFLASPINPNDFSSRLKLVSRYHSTREDADAGHLIIDVDAKSLKAYGNNEFKSMTQELVSNWIKEKEQIPCFLSALNLIMYEKSIQT